jgi:exopolysaccharide production protein ExoZ
VKLRSIQVLRAIAACAVVTLHAYDYIDLDSAARVGAAGVDLFFVISGYIMATVAADKAPGRFLSDRAWRILPLWFIAVTPWLLGQHNSPDTIAASVTLWPVYHDRIILPALGLGWTLAFEFLFYFGFALALASRPLVSSMLFALFFVLGFATGRALFVYLGNPMALEFLAGVVIAGLPRARFGLPIMLCGFVWIALGPLEAGTWMAVSALAIARVTYWGIGAALVVYGAVSSERLFRGKAWNVPVFLGNASYSIYLFHELAVSHFAWPLNLAAGVALGVAVYLLVEKRLRSVRADVRVLRQGVAVQPSA